MIVQAAPSSPVIAGPDGSLHSTRQLPQIRATDRRPMVTQTFILQ
jgi:hypothetical protein